MKTMQEVFSRTEKLLGKEATDTLSRCRVAVFGVGGVGGYVVEGLVRSGVGKIDVVDSDTVQPSNINRQIIATVSSVGRKKVDVIEERIKDINPDCTVKKYPVFFLPENESDFNFSQYDYVVDAVDTVAAKIALVEAAAKVGVPVISSMGAGNKLDPTRFVVADLAKTKVDPLAKVMRKELRKRNIEHLKVVYSDEEPVPVSETERGGKRSPGSVAFVPSVVGLIIAGEVVKDLVKRGRS